MYRRALPPNDRRRLSPRLPDMNHLLPFHSTDQLAYRSFRAKATQRLAHRHSRREVMRHRINMLAAALLLASAAFGVTMAAPPISQAVPQSTACRQAGQSVAPWFEAELGRRAMAPAPRPGEFSLMLAEFRTAQGQCASGLSNEAAANFVALESRIAHMEERRRRLDD